MKASFFDMHDILKNTWVFQQVIKEGKQEELEQQITQFVEIRFPVFLTLANQTIEQKKSAEQLQTMLNALYRANTTEEAQAALLADG